MVQGTEKTLQLSSVNRFLRRLQHETLRQERFLQNGDGPGFYTQTLDDEQGNAVIVLTRATAEEGRQWKAEEAQRKRQAIIDAAGMLRTRFMLCPRKGS